MYQVIIVVHVLLGLGVIGLVLLQQGKGADAGAAFGSSSSGSVFGAQGASSFLSRTTAILAALFFSTSLGLAVLSGHQDEATDLMDTPEVEEVFTDLPLIDGAESVAPIKAIPLNKEDIPEALVSPEEITDSAVNETIEKANAFSDAVQNKAKEVIEDAPKIVLDELDAE
jgi:preprotein translocase subunit SecG